MTDSTINSNTDLTDLEVISFEYNDQQHTVRRLLDPDAIRPIYDPVFVSADESDYSPEELIMGVEINGDARAYPVGVMRGREMVNDVVGDVPILVTW